MRQPGPPMSARVPYICLGPPVWIKRGHLCWPEDLLCRLGVYYVGQGASYFCQRTSHIGHSASYIGHRASFIGKRTSHICSGPPGRHEGLLCRASVPPYWPESSSKLSQSVPNKVDIMHRNYRTRGGDANPRSRQGRLSATPAPMMTPPLKMASRSNSFGAVSVVKGPPLGNRWAKRSSCPPSFFKVGNCHLDPWNPPPLKAPQAPLKMRQNRYNGIEHQFFF